MKGDETVRVREARKGDSEALAALSSQLGYPTTSSDIERRLSGLADSDDSAVMIGEAEAGAVVGWIHVAVVRRLESEPFAEIGGLVVDASSRGRGVGSSLVAAAEDWTVSHGLATLRVRSNILREAAHAYYRRLGFESVKTQGVFVRRLGGEGRLDSPA